MKFEIEVTSELTDQGLRISSTVGEFVQTKLINLEETAIKEALIKLGWTPPAIKPTLKPEPAHTAFEQRWVCLICQSSRKGVHSAGCLNYGTTQEL